MNLAVGERLQLFHSQLLGKRVHPRMFQEVAAVVVDLGFLDALEDEFAGTGAGDETRRVFVRVEVLQEAADGVDVLVDEAVDDEIGGGGEGEEGGALEEGKVGREGG